MALTPLLTLAEVGEYLRLTSETISLLIQKKGLPAAKIGGQWRFDIDEVRDWVRQQRPAGSEEELSTAAG